MQGALSLKTDSEQENYDFTYKLYVLKSPLKIPILVGKELISREEETLYYRVYKILPQLSPLCTTKHFSKRILLLQN